MWRMFYWFAIITAWPVFYPFFRTKVIFEDRKVQGRIIHGSALVVSNHLALFDYVLMAFAFRLRIIRATAAEVMYQKNFVLTAILKGMGMIKVDRVSKSLEFEDRAVDVLEKGGVVQICPESRLPVGDEKRPIEFKKSFVYIALRSGAKIIPVYTNGQTFTRKRAKLVVGKPIDIIALYDKNLDEHENVDRIASYVRDRIMELGKLA